jgi:hypothetical protein
MRTKPSPKPMTVLWSEARRSMIEGKEWNDSRPKWEPQEPPTPRPRKPKPGGA